MRRIVAIFSALMFLLISSNAYADLVAEVTTGVIQKPLVTIVSNNVINDFPLQVNSIVFDDFNHSEKIQGSDSIKYEIKSRYDIPWKRIKADYVVYTKYTRNAYNNYTVEIQVIKRNDKDYIQAITYKNINTSLVRELAHKISNDVYQKVTGDKGFFLTKLAYVKVNNPYSRYGRVYELVISDYDGYNPHVVLKQSDPIATPSWSHDGRFIVYSSYSNGSMGVYRLEISTGKVKRLTNYKGINSSPSYSPNDKYISLALAKGYSDQTNIYIMNLAKKSLKRLTINGVNTAPKFSPDGKNVIFTSDRAGRPNIYVAKVASKYPESKVLNSHIYQGYDASYTPDGKNVIFMYQKNQGSGTQIARLDLSNGSITSLTKGKADSSPTISPNGDMIAYIGENSKGYNILKIVSLDGQNRFTLDGIGGANYLIQSPSWSPKNF